MDAYRLLRTVGIAPNLAAITAEAAARGNERALRFVERAREKTASLDTMLPEAGKRYITRRGQVVGPLYFDEAAELFYLTYPVEGGFWLEWHLDGTPHPDSCPVDDRGHDLVAEVV